MLDWTHYPADTPEALIKAEEILLSAGGHFELVDADLDGRRGKVFKNRPPNLRALVLQARTFGDKEAIVYQGPDREVRLSFKDLIVQIEAVAAAFQAQGIQQGDRIAILAENCPEWLVSFWAAQMLGAIVVGLNGWWSSREIENALASTSPKILIADQKRLAKLEFEPACSVVCIEDDFAGLIDKTNTLDSGDLPEISPNDPAVILFTSGTTGAAKGVVQSHQNICSLLMCNFFHGARLGLAAAIAAGVEPPTTPPAATVFVTSPLFHVSGLHNAAITCMASGTKSVWYAGRFDGERALKLMQREQVTSWGYTETWLKRLLAAMEAQGARLDHFKILGGGGSPIAPELQMRAKSLIPSVAQTFGVGFGQTECGSLATLNPGEELSRHPDSVGRPVPTVELDIRDEAGASLANGEEGEIYVRSPMVMSGYWQDAAATRDVLAEDGWLNTGDWGSIRDGRLYVSARKRDLILRGGENIYPAELELLLEQHPEVQEVAVIGVDDPEFGQVPKAIVVLENGAKDNSPDLQAWLNGKIADFKIPAQWQWREELLPRNATGKVLKADLS